MFSWLMTARTLVFMHWHKQSVACRPTAESPLGCPLNKKLLTSSLYCSDSGSLILGHHPLWGIFGRADLVRASSCLTLHTTVSTDFPGKR